MTKGRAGRTSAGDDARDSFAAVVASFSSDPRVEAPAPKRGSFGSNGLKVDGRTFAMTVRDELVVKLPRERVAALIASGEGRGFESGGRVMKEWITLAGGSWIERAREARAYVGGGAEPVRGKHPSSTR